MLKLHKNLDRRSLLALAAVLAALLPSTVGAQESQSPLAPPIPGAMADIFGQRVDEFDKGLRGILGKPGNLDSSGNVAKNLSPADVAEIRQLASSKLGIVLSEAEGKLLADKFVIDARQAGSNWKETISIVKLYQTGSAAHGFVAESVNYDDLLIRYPKVRFTQPNSKSADLVVLDETSHRPIMGVQTKAYNVARSSLTSGVTDAQAFYADKTFAVKYELHIPKDQYEAEVKAGNLSTDGRLLHPDTFTKQLHNEYEQADKGEAAWANSNAARLREIPKIHGDVDEFNAKVLDKVIVRPLSQTYKEIQDYSASMAAIRKRIVEQSAYKAYLDGLPSDFKVAKNAALVAGAFSALDKLWREGVSKESVKDALKDGAEVGGKAFASTYVASGVMRRYGGRVVFRTWLDVSRMDEKQLQSLLKTLPAKERSLLATHFAGSAFLATFIFDEMGTILSLSAGDISGKEFMFENGKNLVQSSAAAAVTWGAVALGAAPGGLVVTAVVIGTVVIVSKAFDAIEAYEEKKHLSLRDFIGNLPEEIRNRITPFSPMGPSPLEPPRERQSPVEPPPGRQSPLEPPVGRQSPLTPSARETRDSHNPVRPGAVVC